MENQDKKVQTWQVIALIQLVIIIFLGLYANYQRAAFAAQLSYVASVEKTLKDKEVREQELSTRLLTVMALLQRAVNELNGEVQETSINNVVPMPAVK